ncbi:hypothetical protein CASFOL_033835 [Castilleja foliolosa]|uniref:Smr domain-containing protein n=1 Tax=Castilleja foliolosa TaxID=1961234 RepID=A0ABD3BYQ2_9LAMI
MSASTSENSPVRGNGVKAKRTSGWAALQRRKHLNLESNNDSEAYPLLSLSTNTAPESFFNKNGALLEKPFSSVLVPSMNFPSLMDATNRNSERQVPVSSYGHGSSENIETDDVSIKAAYQKLKYLHPWADESLIQDVVAGVNNNVDEALSLLESMLISESENKDAKVEPSGEYIASPLNIDGGSIGEKPDVSFATDDSSSNKESMFDLLLGASKSLPIEPESDSEDDDVYLIHRKDAIKVKRSASRYSKAANVAYLKGDHKLALQFSLKAQQEWTAAEKLNDKAAKEILNVRNCKNDQWTLDLHGLHAAEAVEALRERLQTVESLVIKNFFAIPDHDGVYYKDSDMFTRVKMEKFGRQLPPPVRQRQTLLQVITGKGNHSKGAAALPSAIRNFLTENGYNFDETRSGVIMIRPKFRKQ